MKKIIIMLLMLINAAILPVMAKDIKPKMIPIPGKNYEMLNVEVTQALYEEVMGNNPSFFSYSNGKELFENYGSYNILDFDSNHPVERVSWYDAIRFCNRLSKINGLKKAYTITGDNKVIWDETANGFRLPTVEEWAYAAKGNENYKYSGSDDIYDVAWYSGNSGGKIHPVGQLDPNGYNLYDMSGNVLEWCWDVDPNTGNYRYVCGGGWDYSADYCEVDYRSWYLAEVGRSYIGFRIVRTVK